MDHLTIEKIIDVEIGYSSTVAISQGKIFYWGSFDGKQTLLAPKFVEFRVCVCKHLVLRA